MDQRKINVLVVDDNREMCDILGDYFRLSDQVDGCAFAFDGSEALHKIRAQHPDVVLLDLIMPQVDGISVLQQLWEKPADPMPAIIVTSAIGQERVTRQALRLGACYYMIKPYRLEDLLQRILMFAPNGGWYMPEGEPARSGQREAELVIAREVMGLGVPTNLLGYNYIIAALRMLLEHIRPIPTAKQIYAAIAEENGTTADCVESAIRKIIQRSYDVHNKHFCALMGLDAASADRRPSNSKFLTMLAEKLRQEQSW